MSGCSNILDRPSPLDQLGEQGTTRLVCAAEAPWIVVRLDDMAHMFEP